MWSGLKTPRCAVCVRDDCGAAGLSSASMDRDSRETVTGDPHPHRSKGSRVGCPLFPAQRPLESVPPVSREGGQTLSAVRSALLVLWSW